MPSNSEMYERGALDAEHDELNDFYYQHYYYYRRGYDDARRRSRARGGLPLTMLLAALMAAALAAGAWWLLGRERAPVATAPAVTAPAVAPTARPTLTPRPTASPTAPPTAVPALAVGGRARVVDLGGAPLRAREAPSLQARVTARIPAGSEVTLLEGPVDADGYTWWRVEASGAAGWAAGRSAEGVVFLEVVP
jgi:hypothetical protein